MYPLAPAPFRRNYQGKIAFAESPLSNYDDNSNTNLNFDFIGSPIYNSGNIGNITGDFIGHVPGDYRTINNEYRGDQDNVSIGDITGNFIGTRGIYNFIDGNTAYDGSTYNLSIGNITSSLIAANSNDQIGHGGFLSNENGTVGNITADYIVNNNLTMSNSGEFAYGMTSGCVIYNSGNPNNYYQNPDQTLGRIEIGGRYGFTDALSGYAWANYTFGSSYDAYALSAGMSYAW